jgi:hypothetical protein
MVNLPRQLCTAKGTRSSWTKKGQCLRETPKGRTFGKRHRGQEKCNNGVRDRGLRQELRLGSKETFYEALGQIVLPDFTKRAFEFSVGLREMSVKDIVEEPATAQAKEETTYSLRAREVEARTTLGTFARSPRKEGGETGHRYNKHTSRGRRNGGTPASSSGRIALRSKQCGTQTCCWATTSKQITRRRPLLCNNFVNTQ